MTCYEQQAGWNGNVNVGNEVENLGNSSGVWEQAYQIKILFRKKLRADCSQAMLAIIRCRMFCVPVCCPKI